MDLPLRPASLNSLSNMEIYATGHNAWNQLCFDQSTPEEPDDILTFAKILSALALSRPVARRCYTAIQRDKVWSLAGDFPDELMSRKDNKTCLLDRPHAISGNSNVLTVEPGESSRIVLYPSLDAWNSASDSLSWPCESPIHQIAAYETGFVILHCDASVSTIGDPRFADCLGRPVSESSPASEPCTVTNLSELGEPVKKVAAGGYAVAALTEGGGLYLWGMDTPGPRNQHQVFETLSGIPNYVEVDGDKDVQDAALGESHAIALTTDGCIYVLGINTSGQLGLGKASEGLDKWARLDFEVSQGWKVIGVEAGPRSSFIITEKMAAT